MLLLNLDVTPVWGLGIRGVIRNNLEVIAKSPATAEHLALHLDATLGAYDHALDAETIAFHESLPAAVRDDLADLSARLDALVSPTAAALSREARVDAFFVAQDVRAAN